MNPYAVLDVPHDADEATIKRAFRKKASEAHPDRKDGDAYLMSKLNQAKDILLDPERRARYDATGESGAKLITDEQRATELLLDLMNELLNDPSLLVRYGTAHKAINGGLSSRSVEIELAIQEQESRQKHARRLCGQIRRKDGTDNHFETLCNTYADGLAKHIADMQHDLVVNGIAIGILNGEYESTVQDVKTVFSDNIFLQFKARFPYER